jgi:hypothetical protein
VVGGGDTEQRGRGRGSTAAGRGGGDNLSPDQGEEKKGVCATIGLAGADAEGVGDDLEGAHGCPSEPAAGRPGGARVRLAAGGEGGGSSHTAPSSKPLALATTRRHRRWKLGGDRSKKMTQGSIRQESRP